MKIVEMANEEYLHLIGFYETDKNFESEQTCEEKTGCLSEGSHYPLGELYAETLNSQKQHCISEFKQETTNEIGEYCVCCADTCLGTHSVNMCFKTQPKQCVQSSIYYAS